MSFKLSSSLLLAGLLLAGCPGSDPSKDTDTDCVGFGCPTGETEDPDDTEESDPPIDTEVDSPVVDTEPDDTIDTEPDDTIDTEPDDTIDTEPDDTIDTEPDDTIDTEPDDTIDTEPDDTIDTVIDSPIDTVIDDTIDTEEPPPIDTAEERGVPVVTDLQPGDLIITELMIDANACSDLASEYIEIYNTTDRRIRLNGLIIGDRTNSSTVTTTHVLLPGEYAVGVLRSLSRCPYGFTADFEYTSVSLDNSGDTISLRNATTTLDSVNYQGWGPMLGRAHQLASDALTAGANDLQANWCPAGDTLALNAPPRDFGSPGVASGPCWTPVVIDTDPEDTLIDTVIDTVIDTIDTIDTNDTVVVEDPRVADGLLTEGELREGELLITEVMITPAVGDCTTDRSQYIEVYNTTAYPIAADNLLLNYAGSTVLLDPEADDRIEAGTYAVLVRQNSGQTFCFQTIEPSEYRYRTHRLAAGLIALQNAGGTIDSVNLTGWTIPTGASLQLLPGQLSAGAPGNDSELNWCPAVNFIGTHTSPFNSLGTPGLPTNCVPPEDTAPEESDTVVDTVVDSVIVDDRLDDGVISYDELLPGELAITEILVNPDPADCSVNGGQYIEVYNTTDHPITLDDLSISYGATTVLLELRSGVADLVGPGEFAVLVRRGVPQNFCFDAASPWQYRYGNITLGQGLVRLFNANGDIDAVNLTGWSLPSGGSVQLRPELGISSTVNDNEASWCDAMIAIRGPTGRFETSGTPGEPNNCDEPVDTAPPPPERDPTDGLDATELLPGELVISEVMIATTDCTSARGQYLELYNNTPYTVYPAGLLLDVGSDVNNVVEFFGDAPAVPPRGFAMVKRRATVACYTGFDVEFRFPSDLDLDLTLVRLHNGSVTLDTVDFSPFTITPGTSQQLRPDVIANNPTQNDTPANWCPAVTPIVTNAADFGTPNAPNDCTGAGPGGDSDTQVEDPFTGLYVSDLVAGNLLVTELMESPFCGAGQGEWFEVYNNTDREIDLNGLQIDLVNRSRSLVIERSLVVAPRDYALFARIQSTQTCTLDADYFYPGVWSMVAGGNILRLSRPAGTGPALTIDEVNTTTFGLVEDGFSSQLHSGRYSRTLNDLAENWCRTPQQSNFELLAPGTANQDYGTPGADNNICVPPIDSDDTEEVGLGDTEEPEDTLVDVEFTELAELSAGDIVITEFMVQPQDCASERTAEYIEVYNTTDVIVDLRYLTVEDEDGEVEWRFRALVGPGEYALGVNVKDAPAPRCYDLDADFSYEGATLDNNGDYIRLRSRSGVVLDEVNFEGWARQLGRAWQLKPEVGFDAVANDVEGSWCPAEAVIPGAVNDRGTPRMPNVCLEVPDTDTDTDPVVVDPNDGLTELFELQAGDLVLTELMVATAEPGCTDFNTEYIEFYNAADEPVDLFGLVIRNRGGAATQFQLLDHLIVPPGEHVVGARFDAQRCYPIGHDFVYTGFTLDNRGDSVQLRAGAVVVDEVNFRSWARATAGRAMQLNGGSVPDAASNDQQLLWCNAPDRISGAAVDRGSPGEANPVCPIFVTDPGESDSEFVGESDTDVETDVDTLVVPPCDSCDYEPIGGGTPASALLPGQLVITELMVDPRACIDSKAEYIELYNNTDAEIDLNGLTIATLTGSSTITTPTPVGPRRYVLGLLQNSTRCYGLEGGFSYQSGTMSNVSETVTVRAGSTVLDVVSTAGWVPITGASWQLDVQRLTVGDNDQADAWCPSELQFVGSGGDFGSPGLPNVSCAAPPDSDTDTDLDSEVLSRDTTDTFSDDPSIIVTPIDEAVVGEILITEFFLDPRDCADGDAEYIEIYNNSAKLFELNGLRVSNGISLLTVQPPDGPWRLEPGQVTVIRRESATQCYEFGSRASYRSMLLGAPSTVIYIANANTVIDAVNYGGFDALAGRAWTLDWNRTGLAAPGGFGDAPGSSSLTADYPNDDASHWCPAYYKLPGATGDKGSPGRQNDRCLAEGEPLPYGPDYVAHVDELDGGELLITEIMINPDACSDLLGEWFEFRNVWIYPIAVDGLRVKNAYGTTSIIDGTSTVIEPGQTFLARRAAGSYTNCFPGMEFDVVYPSLALDNGADLLSLSSSHTPIDVVDFRGWVVPRGASLSLDPTATTAIDNDQRDAWCAATSLIPPSTVERGTPGSDNDSCAPVGDTDEEAEILSIADAAPGDLIITEYLIFNEECQSSSDQYIEIYNRSDSTFNLNGLRIRDQRSFAVVNESAVIAPGEYAVGRSSVPGACLQIAADFRFTGFTFQFAPPNLRIEFGTTIIDQVNTTQWLSGYEGTFQLAPGLEVAGSNEAEDDWCLAQVPIPGNTTAGTPGQPNDCAAPDTDLGGDTDETDEPDDTQIDPEPVSYREAFYESFVSVAPGVFYFGVQDTKVITVDVASGVETWECLHRYDVTATSVANVSASCPSCLFAFNLRRTYFGDGVALFFGQPSECGDYFGGLGEGGPMPDITLAYSPIYGAVFYVTQGGGFEVYTYNAEYTQNSFRYRRTVQLDYYY